MNKIQYEGGRYTISAPFDIGPRLLPSLKLSDGSRVSIGATSWTPERRVSYRYFVDDADGKQLLEGDDISSGVGGPVDLDDTFRAFAAFLSAWVEAHDYPDSDNRDLFPESLFDWADAHHEELAIDTLEEE